MASKAERAEPNFTIGRGLPLHRTLPILKSRVRLPLAHRVRSADRNARPICAVWELTLRCDLACRHCSSRASRPRRDELMGFVASAIAGHAVSSYAMTGLGSHVGTGAVLVEIVATNIAASGTLMDANERYDAALRLGSKTGSAYAGEYTLQTNTTVEQLTSTTIANSAPHLVAVRLDGSGGIEVRVDGLSAGSKTGATLDLGNFPGIIASATLAEVIVVAGTLTASQVNGVEAYLKTKYAL